MTPPPCSLCSSATTLLAELEGRPYWRCGTCALTQLDSTAWLGADAERAVYQNHENDVDDPGYRRFLSKLADPLLTRLSPGSQGLDYGCGPGPALAAMLQDAGHQVALFDPFFFDAPAALERSYDFITCTETAEHFHRPRSEFARLNALLRPGGWLAVMTCFQTDDARFKSWHYRRDPTHVVFYREQTMRHLADLHGWSCDIPAKDVVLFHKAQAQ